MIHHSSFPKELVEKHHLVVHRIAPVIVVVLAGPLRVLVRDFFFQQQAVHLAVGGQEKIAQTAVNYQVKTRFSD